MKRLAHRGGFAALGLVGIGVLMGSVQAQHELASPYRQQHSSEIRGLSPKEIDDLREGRGMGLARAAELNSYPGPRHVLDAVEAGQLHLSAEQLFDDMSVEAKRLGGVILNEEPALERAFREGRIGESDLQARVARIAALQGELRLIHLRTHLQTRALLSAHQTQRSNQLRGYSGGEPRPEQHKH